MQRSVASTNVMQTPMVSTSPRSSGSTIEEEATNEVAPIMHGIRSPMVSTHVRQQSTGCLSSDQDVVHTAPKSCKSSVKK
eukprot:10181172-Lingulodinium_polyedra.AAC.1